MDKRNDLGGQDHQPVADAVERMRPALEGLTAAEQLAALAQVTGYVLITAEHMHGKDMGQVARTTYATMLRNVCAQWRRTYRASKA